MQGGGVLIHDKKIGMDETDKLDDTLNRLQTALVSLYAKLDKIKSLISTVRSRDQAWYSDLVCRYEKLVRELVAIRQAGDETIVRMTPEQRRYFVKTAPTFFKILGWHGRIDENGNIKYDA